MGDLVLSYDAAVDAGPSVVGGKGWNPGRLHHYGFPVPPGGVLVAEAYFAFMAAPALETTRTEMKGNRGRSAPTEDIA